MKDLYTEVKAIIQANDTVNTPCPVCDDTGVMPVGRGGAKCPACDCAAKIFDEK